MYVSTTNSLFMKIKLIVAFLFVTQLTQAQDIQFARKMVDTLTSSYFWGRGYTKDGMGKAADFLAAQLTSYGVKPMNDKNLMQEFSYPVNTFPGRMEVAVNGITLVPGKDYLVRPDSRGIKSEGKLTRQDSIRYFDIPN
ncbi:MAG: aminopeptidase, partial [Sphingobacteriales bacterium]